MHKKSEIIISLSVFIFVLLIYILTLPPTVWFIDSGELAAVAITLGIAHPTGYPFFTIVAHLFTWLPIGTEIYRNNLLSGVFCALGAFMMFYLIRYLFSFYSPLPEDSKGKKSAQASSKLSNLIIFSITIFTCLILAFSKTYWFVVRLGKVYPIHVFLIITMILVFLKAIYDTKLPERLDENKNYIKASKYYFIFAYLLGLAFTNHMTTILIVPAWLVIFIIVNYERYKNILSLFKILVLMAIFFIIGVSVYLYLPIRASENPMFIWGNPATLEKFLWHISGKQFQVWIFSAQGSLTTFLILFVLLVIISCIGIIKRKTLSASSHLGFVAVYAIITYFLLSSSTETAPGQDSVSTQFFNHFIDPLWSQFGFGIILLAIPGIYRLSKHNIKIFYFTILIFFTCLIYSVNYSIYDIDSYFLLAYITLTIWIAFGSLYIYEVLFKLFRDKNAQVVFSAFLIILFFICLGSHYGENDESKNYKVEDYTMNIFKNAEPNGIIISSQWDFWLASGWYYHFVKHMYPDIVAIDKELLRRSWYFKFIELNYPDVYKNSKTEIENFIPELYKFEHNIPYDQPTIMKRYEELLTSFVTNNPDRNVYTTWEIEQNRSERFAVNYARIPDGLLLRLVKKSDFPEKKKLDYNIYDFKFTPTDTSNYWNRTLTNTYYDMLTSSANFLQKDTTFNISDSVRQEGIKKYKELAALAISKFTLRNR